MSQNIPSPKIPNPDLGYDPEKNSKPDRVASKLNKNDPQYTLEKETTYHNRNKNYPPFLGRKQRPNNVPMHDLDN